MTSREFYNLLEINVFFRLIFLTRTWNIGMMEYWNNDLNKDDIPLFNFRQEEFYNNPSFHFLSEP